MSSRFPGNYAICLVVAVLAFFLAGTNVSAFVLHGQQQRINDDDDLMLRPISSIVSSAESLMNRSPFGRHQMKRMAEFNKRERIIMDALGGNDFLIKRSSFNGGRLLK